MKTTGKRNIVICSTSYHETDRRLIRIIESLVKEGYRISWISRSHNRSKSKQSRISHIIINALFKKGPLFYLEYNCRLWLKIRKQQQSIICAVDLDTIPGAYLGGKSNTNIIIHDAHEIYYEVPELSDKRIKKGIWKTIARFFLPRIKYNYTVNTSLAQHYSSKYGTQYEVIRNIGPKPNLELKSKKFEKIIAYLGVLNMGRGLEIAIEVMRERNDYKLIILGEGDNSEALRKQAEGLANVEFVGLVPPDQIFKILTKADLGLNILSASSLNYELSLANKFFDYLHAELPSINMNYPEYNHILNSHFVGIKIDDYSKEALSTGLDKISESATYKLLKTNCRKYKHLYDWSHEEVKLIQLYRNIDTTF